MIKRFIYIVVILVVALLGAAFSVRNGHLVDVNYYLGELSLPLSVVMVAAFAVGVLLATLVLSFSVMKLRMQLHSAKRRYRQLEESYSKKAKQLDDVKLGQKREAALPETVD